MKSNKNKYQMYGVNLGKTKHNFKNKTTQEDDDEDEGGSAKHLGYFTKVQQSTLITIPIDEAVREASYYRAVVNAISGTSEDDVIEFDINSVGGRLDGLIALLTALERTEAISCANINGECHSAASMLALSCDSLTVSPYASMLCHFVSYGASGKATDVKSHVNHIHDTCENLFRSVYQHFLTEDEIEKCIGGYELWLNAAEIAERLDAKYKYLNKLEEIKQLEQEKAELEEKQSDIPHLCLDDECLHVDEVVSKVKPKKVK